MCLIVRLASLNDAKEITEVHCSDVTEWFRYEAGRRVKAGYGELSVEERFLHGGPWMSVETCAVHLNYVLSSGQYPLVAVLDGRVVGELELYVGGERGLLDEAGFIDVLVVHSQYRRRGVGRALVREAGEIACEKGCGTLSVWPEKDAVAFYRKCGLDKVAYRVAHVVVKPGARVQGYETQVFPENYDDLRDMLFISPRMKTGFTAWLKSMWPIAVETGRAIHERGTVTDLDMAYIMERLPGGEACVTLWVRDKEAVPRPWHG